MNPAAIVGPAIAAMSVSTAAVVSTTAVVFCKVMEGNVG